MISRPNEEPTPAGPPPPEPPSRPSTTVPAGSVEFLETTPPIYALALDRRSVWLQGTEENRTVVIYRLSHVDSNFFVSRQLDPCGGGDEKRTGLADEETAKKLGYDLFIVPTELVEPASGDETELTQAILAVCKLGQQGPPTDGGPNVIKKPTG